MKKIYKFKNLNEMTMGDVYVLGDVNFHNLDEQSILYKKFIDEDEIDLKTMTISDYTDFTNQFSFEFYKSLKQSSLKMFLQSKKPTIHFISSSNGEREGVYVDGKYLFSSKYVFGIQLAELLGFDVSSEEKPTEWFTETENDGFPFELSGDIEEGE